MGKTDSLGPFEQIVLTAVLLLREKAYGLSVWDKTSELSGKRVNIGSIYVTLDRLEDKGYITTWLADPTPERGWRAKRYVRVEAAGERALQESLSTSRRLDEAAEGFWGLGRWRRNQAK